MIVTGGNKLASKNLLYIETGWIPLYKRRDDHRLIQQGRSQGGATSGPQTLRPIILHPPFLIPGYGPVHVQ